MLQIKSVVGTQFLPEHYNQIATVVIFSFETDYGFDSEFEFEVIGEIVGFDYDIEGELRDIASHIAFNKTNCSSVTADPFIATIFSIPY